MKGIFSTIFFPGQMMKYFCRIKSGHNNNDISPCVEFETQLIIQNGDRFMVDGFKNINFASGFSSYEEKAYVYRVVGRQLCDDEKIILFVDFRQDHSYLRDVFDGI
jgi:hypothetical protein